MKHNDITVARATIADIDAILKWRIKGIVEDSADESIESIDCIFRNTRKFLYDTMPSRKYEACIAHSYCGMLGCGGILFYYSLPTAANPKGLYAIIENIVVDENLRGEGIEECIYSWLQHEALQRGAIIVKNVESPINALKEEIAI